MLIVLDSPNRKLVADQSSMGMVNCNVTVTYADHDGSTFVEGTTPSTLDGMNKVVILDSPASGVRRVIKSITFYNSDDMVHEVGMYLRATGGMDYPIVKIQLPPKGSWSSDDQTGVNVGALTNGDKGDIVVTDSGQQWTLKTVNANVGQFGNATNIPKITVNAKGLVTAISTEAISIPSGSLSFTGEVTGSGFTGQTTTLNLSSTGVTAATYGSASKIPIIAIDSKGRITSASEANVSIPSGSISVTGSDLTMSGSTGTAITNATLSTTGVAAGTYTKLTVDLKGRVTAGANLSSADLPTYTGTLTSLQVTNALGFTPYSASNPNGYTNNTGTVTSVSGSGSVNGITLSGSGNSVVALTLGGTLTGVNLSTQVTGTLPVANGGTGATTAANARANLGAAAVTGTVVPSADSGTGSIGTSTEAARADHVHPAGAGGGRELLTANRTYYVGFNIPGTCSFTSANPTVVTLTNHGLSAGTPVVFTAPSGSTVPTGLIPGAIYYVKDNTTNQTNTFQIALIPGGTSIATTSTGSGLTCRTGNDTNNGLTLSRTGALLTPQRAIELLGGIDMGAYNVIIQLANGRYTDCVEFYPFLGSGTVTLQGDTTTWTNVVLEPYSCGNVGYSTSTGLFTNFGTSGSTPTPHNFIDGTPISINTFLALPVGLVPRKTYYVQNVASSGANAFQIWTAPVGGSRVQPTTTGSGTYGGNFCIYGDSYSSKYILRGLTIGGSIRGYSIGIFNAPLDITQCHFAGSPNKWAHLYAGGGAKIAFVDNWSVGVGGDEGCFFSDASYITARTSACTITTSFTSNNFFSATRAGVILADAATYINPTLMTGSRGRASINGVLRGSSTALPGSTGPTSDYSAGGGGQYQDAG